MVRMRRKGRFHFEGEHAFWNPTSPTELAWYYATSVDYLFGNAIHSAQVGKVKSIIWKDHEPILDYSGGVGNNIIHLTQDGVKTHYFGIGVLEYRFAKFRFQKLGLEHLVEFKEPFCNTSGFVFDPVTDPLPKDQTLGAILAFDVLEHIPEYHTVVKAMVRSIRVGGIILENSPFAPPSKDSVEVDTRVHVSNGGIPMQQAMGPCMKQIDLKIPGVCLWEKIEHGTSCDEG